MPRLSRYLLSLLAIAGASFAPIQSYAQSKDVAKTERRTSGQKAPRKKFNINRLRITADKEQKKAIENALQEINETPAGEKLLKRLPKNLEISVVEESGYAGFYSGKVTLNSGLFDNSDALSIILIHELRHANQAKEGRCNRGIPGDGIEGIADYVTAKLFEVETQLFGAIYAFEKGNADVINGSSDYSFYKRLREGYQKEGCDDKTADKLARTEYVRRLWESSPEETEGPDAFRKWSEFYIKQFSESYVDREVRRQDFRKEYNLIQKFITEMNVDLGVDYFMNKDHIHLPTEQMAMLMAHEEMAQRLKRGSCTRFCPKQPKKGAVAKPDKAVAPRAQ